MTCEIITLAELKAYLGITDTAHDVFLQSVVDGMSDQLGIVLNRDICYQIKDFYFNASDVNYASCFFSNRPEIKFVDADFTGQDQDGSDLVNANIEYNNQTFVKVNDTVVEFDDLQVWSTGKICVCECGCYVDICSKCPDRIQVRAIVGFETIPNCFKTIAYDLGRGSYESYLDAQGTTGSRDVKSEKIGDYAVSYEITDAENKTVYSSAANSCIKKYKINNF